MVRQQPKHQRLRESVVRLMDGLPADAPLPPERELCETHGVSRQTVRRALQQLVAEGRVYRRRGSGTYVAGHKVVQAVDLDGRDPRGTAEAGGHSRLIGIDRRRADPREAATLELAEGTEVLHVTRARTVGGESVGVERLTVEAARFDGRWASVPDADAVSRLFWDSHGLEVAEAEQTIEAVRAQVPEASLLGVADGVPLLLVTQRTLDSEGRPTQLVRSWYRGDRLRLSTRPRHGPPNAGVVLRPARRADAPVLARIFVQAWRSAYHGVVDDLVLEALDEGEMASRFAEFIGETSARHNAMLAVHGGEPVGFARFGEDPDLPVVGHVFSLYVTPDSMGLGVGRTLLGEVLAELAARGHRQVTLWVFEANSRARRLYERMGFRADGGRRVEDAYGAQEIRLSRELGT